MNIPWRKVRQRIEQHAKSYVVAVSGGVDSMFLLDFVSKCNVKLHIAHVNHGLRKESILEAALVKETANKLSLPFSMIELTNLGSTNVESQAREQRYAFFKQLQNEYGLEKVMTAHHLNDQVETILLRLMRGVPHTDLSMKEDNGFVFRPLLEVPKEVIIEQAQKRNIVWMEDASNTTDDYERNWVRNSLIPQMMERRNVLKTIPKGIVS